jgi:hypothetical protein
MRTTQRTKNLRNGVSKIDKYSTSTEYDAYQTLPESAHLILGQSSVSRSQKKIVYAQTYRCQPLLAVNARPHLRPIIVGDHI